MTTFERASVGNQTRCVMDSAYWIDIAPIDGSYSLSESAANVRWLANTTGILSEECRAAYPGNEDWKCMVAQYRFPFVKTPYFLQHAQYDSFGVKDYLGHAIPPEIEVDWAFPFIPHITDYDHMKDWQRFFLGQIANIPTLEQEESAVYVPACTTHGPSVSNFFWNMKIHHKTSMADALEQWLAYDYEQEGPAQFRWVADPEHSIGYITIECTGVPEVVFVIICCLLSLSLVLFVYEVVRWCHIRRMGSTQSSSKAKEGLMKDVVARSDDNEDGVRDMDL